MGIATIIKLIAVAAILASLAWAGYRIKRMWNAELNLTKCEHELSLAAQNNQNLSDGVESGLKEAAGKCGKGHELDAAKKQYKIDVETCKEMLAKRALEIAKKAGELVK